jgi:hypothetical protein
MRTALLPQDIRALFSCYTVGALLRMLDEHGHQVKERQSRVVLPWISQNAIVIACGKVWTKGKTYLRAKDRRLNGARLCAK